MCASRRLDCFVVNKQYNCSYYNCSYYNCSLWSVLLGQILYLENSRAKTHIYTSVIYWRYFNWTTRTVEPTSSVNSWHKSCSLICRAHMYTVSPTPLLPYSQLLFRLCTTKVSAKAKVTGPIDISMSTSGVSVSAPPEILSCNFPMHPHSSTPQSIG